MSGIGRVIAALLVAAVPASGQAWSDVGTYLEPWGGDGSVAGFVTMSADGESILIVETGWGTCWGPFSVGQRISSIRSDGTGHQVLVDTPSLTGLYPNGPTIIDRVTMSGDGSRAAFSWPGTWDWSSCVPWALSEWYLVDPTSGAVTPFDFNGFPVGIISFSDDGTKMAFKGFDPVSSTWSYYLADGDGSNPVQIIDASGWCGGFGILSGDGNKFLLMAVNDCFCPCDNDILLYDVADGSSVQLNPGPVDTAGISLSYDGSRVVYEDGSGNIVAVNGDGTGAHFLALDSAGGGATTISRDGEYVFFLQQSGGTTQGYRIRFDGTDQIPVPGTVPFGPFIPRAISGDGSVYAFFDSKAAVGDQDPLGVWFDDTPVLWTYGFGNPGTPLTWDVGGQPGETFILAFSLGLLPTPAGTQYGPLELDPASLFVLASGVVEGTANIGSVQIMIPPTLSLPGPVPLHFQALVQPREGGGSLTNRTTVLLQDAATAAATAPAGRGPAWGTAEPAAGPSSTAPSAPAPTAWPITPEERLRRLASIDPQIGQWYFEDH